MKLPSDLREFVESLNAADVEYLIVGGVAVVFHGYPRFTGDLDVFVRASEANGKRIVDAIGRFGFQSLDVRPADFAEPNQIIQFGFPPHRVDVITTIEAVDFEEAWRERILSEIDGIPAHFIGKAHLIRNKKATGRAQDLADVERLTESS